MSLLTFFRPVLVLPVVLCLGACALTGLGSKPPPEATLVEASSEQQIIDPRTERRQFIMGQLRQNQYLRVNETPGGEIIAQVRSGNVFKIASPEISAEMQPVFEQIAAVLKAHPWLNVRIIGHSDNSGDPQWNLALSVRRAESAGRALMASGVDMSRVSYEGRGDTEPLVPNTTEEGRNVNRRIDLMFTENSASTSGQEIPPAH